MDLQARTRLALASRKSIGIIGRVVNRVRTSAGAPPGTMVHTGERKTERVVTRFIDYDEELFQEGELALAEASLPFATSPTVSWIDVTGLHDVEHIEALGQAFNLHPLILEDIVNPGQRPKIEEYADNFFIVLKMLAFDSSTRSLQVDQVSLVVGRNYVLSFQEQPWDVFEPVRNRLRQSRGKIRRNGSDYLAYAICDVIVDGYFKVLEDIGDEIEEIEELVLTDATTEIMHRIHALKREVLVLRKAVWPLREVLGMLYRNEMDLVTAPTRVYLRDAYDHLVQVIDTIEAFRDLLSGTMDLYISTVSNRMNEVMKVLTIIATIFIPLSFFAGVYGMNFDYMPELRLRWGYPALLLIMFGAAAGMLWYFRRRRWL